MANSSSFSPHYQTPQVVEEPLINVFSGIVAPLYGISLFLPTIIRSLGYTSSTAQLLTVPIYVTASVLAVVVAWLSDRFGKRYPFILVCMSLMAIGFIMCISSNKAGVIYAGVFIAACALYPAFPGNITWLSNSTSVHYLVRQTFR
jgi:MFS family permease